MAVKDGDKVKVEYSGKLDDGSEFDNSQRHEEPLEFKVGEGQIIKGFDDAVKGMEVGEKKEFSVEPEQGYGEHKEELIKKIPKDKLPEGDIKEGSMVALQTPDGQQIPAQITDIGDEEVTLDINHPLSGKTLHFDIKVIEVNEE